MVRQFTAVLSTLLLALTASMAGRAIFTNFTGHEIPLGPPLAPGSVMCPGGQPTGDWPLGPPCPAGTPFHIRGLAFAYTEQSSDPRMAGDAVVVVNANWDGFSQFGPGSGPMWGTFRLVIAGGGGVWEGTWVGDRIVREDGAYSSIHGVLHGSEGGVAGMKAEMEVEYTPASPLGVTSGRILVPGGK